MRTARFAWVLLPLVLAVVVPALPAAAHAATASLSAMRPVVGVIHIRDGDSIPVAHVGPWALNAVRYFTPAGEPGYLSTHQISRIVSAAGHDVSRRVLDDRKSLGESGLPPPPTLSSWLAAPFRYPSTRGRAYTIVEFSWLDGDDRSDVGGDGVVSVGIGGMARLSPSWSLGGVVHLTSGGFDGYRAGDVGVRVRRYLGDRTGVDLTAGVFSADGGAWDTRGIPAFGEAAVTYADAVSLVARVERATWEGNFVDHWASSRSYRDERRQTVWRTGVRLGPSPSWASIPLFVVGSLIFLTPSGRDLY
jgi:hypothetical protein